MGLLIIQIIHHCYFIRMEVKLIPIDCGPFHNLNEYLFYFVMSAFHILQSKVVVRHLVSITLFCLTIYTFAFLGGQNITCHGLLMTLISLVL
jgi:hypothetical protein